ncbi:hypothetical protein [Enterococcus faecalis]|uniref:hypothetical protein n=1 Tax=Enterococcus faecalis TaxID=1351 RepID=UPI0020917B3C|nr:hypothetical protein [Enterococcus faecalis]MCO5542324.1 hypothetical protein [Enterococcus faecalis]
MGCDQENSESAKSSSSDITTAEVTDWIVLIYLNRVMKYLLVQFLVKKVVY